LILYSGFFVVVNGVPSVGVKVMLGSGQFEDQTMNDIEALPTSSDVTASPDQSHHGAAAPSAPMMPSLLVFLFVTTAWLLPQL
jgi:hypothetical protein